MLRKGFTLIELLIVITIIAILAGSAVPYVQDYVEDARISKARSDMNEIKNALTRYELDRGVAYMSTDIGALVGPYLDKAIADPWGQPFYISPNSSVVFSAGPNRESVYVSKTGAFAEDFVAGAAGSSGDDLSTNFRPPLAISKVYYLDTNVNAKVDADDQLKIRFTRPIDCQNALTQTSWMLKIGSANYVAVAFTDVTAVGMDATTKQAREIVMNFNTEGLTMVPGRDTIKLPDTPTITDASAAPFNTGATCAQNEVLIKSIQ